MIRRPYLFGSLLLLVLAAVLFWQLRSRTDLQSVPPIPDQVEAVAVTSPPLSSSQVAPIERQLPGGPAEPSDLRWEERRRREKEDPGYEWKLPINFYGRVVDDSELPVPGANIWFQWSDLSPEGASEEETVSDANGLFMLTGKQGNGLSLRITKRGYYTPQRGNQFRFENARFWDANYHEPNPDNPVFFHLQKKGEAEPLIVALARPRVPRDGTPVRVDLFNKGAISPSGQLEIAAWLPPENPNQRGLFDWRAKLSLPEGGVREHNDEFPFIAPEDGYIPEVVFDMPAAAPDWRQVITQRYYFRIGTPPQFGRMEVRINGASQVVNVNYWLNPSGSRNLEYDSGKQLTAK